MIYEIGALGIKALLFGILNIYQSTDLGSIINIEIPHCAIGDETHRVEAVYPFPLWNGTNDSVYIPEGKIEILKEVGEGSSVQWEDLMSMCIQESTDCSEDTIGDEGMSFGAFQIHSYWNPVSDEIKGSFKMQAEWTAIRLRNSGYKQDRRWAIQAHNTRNDPTMRYSNAVVSRSEHIKKEKK